MMLLISMESVKAYTKWFYEDLMKEKSDRFEEGEIDEIAIASRISALARKWYIIELQDVASKEMKALAIITL
jgi:hypothetical protein